MYTGLPTLQSVYSLDVSARGQYDTLCPHAPGTNGFQLVIKAQSGNLPALQATSSLTTSSTGTPGGNITITTNDAETPVDYCNGIGRCDQLTGSCKCPLGFGFSSDRGECGTLAINSSQWTGIETCPGVIDQTSLQEITTYDEVSKHATVFFFPSVLQDKTYTFSSYCCHSLSSCTHTQNTGTALFHQQKPL